MDKQARKSEIGFLGVAAALAKMCIDKDGVIDVGTWLDRRKMVHEWQTGVFLQPWKFMELFGDDTEYEYMTDRFGDMQIVTTVNGVVYYAIIQDYDLIQDGRLVV
jgi:hypothetical protein